MLRIYQCRSAAAAQSYFTQGLSREDYYTQGQEIAGRWGGEAARPLGLLNPPAYGSVTREGFVALTENRHPGTGRCLTPRTKVDRTIGYDFNFHAPKGVSLLHAIHGDQRILETFRRAVDETMRDIEADAAARVRKAGVQDDRVTGNLVWGEFVHLTARPTRAADGPDPHLHAHCFVFNATFDPVEERWKAAQFRQLVRDAPYYEAGFHARLAAGLRDLGYPVERTATGWDLAGLPRPLIEKYSTRTREIEEAASILGITDPTARGQLGARTRKGKDKDRKIDDLRSAWDQRLTKDERALLRRLADGGTGPGAPPNGDPDGTPPGSIAARCVDRAIEHCFARRSVMPERRLIAEALKLGVGQVSLEDAWAELKTRPMLSRVVRGQVLTTTLPVIEEERALVTFAVEGKGACDPVRQRIIARTGEDWWIHDQRLSPDQRRAVEHVLDSPDRVVAIRGAAGVGKTTMMTEAVVAIRAGGQPVVVVAPTAEAARGPDSLRTKGFAGADTVAKFLSSSEMQRGLKSGSGVGGVLWVDEAGLLGVGTLKQLFEVAAKQNARVVLSGDERQHKPVERGDALRVLQRVGGINPVELTTIRRQQGMYREAVAALSTFDMERGVELLHEMGAFREIADSEQRTREAARLYLDTRAEGKSCLVVSPTHTEGRAVAREIRTMQRERGLLKGEDRSYTQLRDTGWTDAQRKDGVRYEKGMVAHFHQAAPGVIAGDRCEVLGTVQRKDGSMAVRAVTPRKVEIDLPLEKAERFQVYKAERIDLAVGDRIRITRNGYTTDRRMSVTNGQMFTVTGFGQHGAIRVAGDRRGSRPRELPKHFGHFAYGSVMTSHSAQGKDVDHVILAQSALSAGAASAEQFYVSVSRGKQQITILTDDPEGLKENIIRLGERQSGLELEAGIAPARLIEPKSSAARGQDAIERFRKDGLSMDTARRLAERARTMANRPPAPSKAPATRRSAPDKDRRPPTERGFERER